MTEKDPLKHADVGETKTIESSTEFSFWDGSACKPFLGRDRDHEDIRIKDAEIVGEKGNEQVKITYEGEATKWMHPDWDSEPRKTGVPKPANRTKPLWARILSFGITVGILGLATAVMHFVFGPSLTEITVNGEALSYEPNMMIVPVVVVLGLSFIMHVGLNGGLPGMAGSKRL